MSAASVYNNIGGNQLILVEEKKANKVGLNAIISVSTSQDVLSTLKSGCCDVHQFSHLSHGYRASKSKKTRQSFAYTSSAFAY
jgi:hypothetical protein